ncbi:MAG: hypothetical protein ABIN89_11965 [Chitinophagaceae bacterium]
MSSPVLTTIESMDVASRGFFPCKYAKKQVASGHERKIKKGPFKIIKGHGYKRNQGNNKCNDRKPG